MDDLTKLTNKLSDAIGKAGEALIEVVLDIDFVTALITNSSSTVYSSASTPEALHELFNEVLTLGQATLTSEDIFDIYIMPYGETASSYIDENQSEYPDLVMSKEYDWDAIDAYIMKRVKARTAPSEWFSHGDYEEFESSRYLIILANDGETKTDLGKKLLGLFYHQGSYDG
jgi:hypothetical protein